MIQMDWLHKPMPDFFVKFAGEPDFRVRNWTFLSNPKLPILAVCSYLLFIFVGTRWMKNRKGFDLKIPLIMHNYIQIALSVYIFKETLLSVLSAGRSPLCFVLDKTDNPVDYRLASAFWWFYASKFYDLFDTVFLVLRKKTEQLSFLHIYHHATMLFNWYLGILYLPGGQTYLSMLLNSFVHIVMYTYYFLAAFGPRTQKYLWWKKYLTQIQLIQFVMIITHVAYGYFTGCDQPGWLSWFTCLYLFTLISLFTHFYRKSYKSKSKKKIDQTNGYISDKKKI